MNSPYEIAPDVYVLSSAIPIPGFGMVPVNAFLVQGEEPVLIDTGLRLESDAFLASLASLVSPADLRWIVLTHDDTDHTGSLERLLALAPKARLLTHALGAIRAYATFGIPLERVDAITVGDEIPVGERRFKVLRPPLFDNPVTLGLHDPQSGILFCADAFGGILPRWAKEAGDYTPEELSGALIVWGSFDSPWVRSYDRSAYSALLDEPRQLGPHLVLSSHLPPARGMLEQLLGVASRLPDAPPFVPPNREIFAQIAAGVKVAA